MNKIIRTFEETLDGIVYVVNVYEDGRIERKRKEGQENALTNTEQAALEMQANIEYLVELAELNVEV